MVIRNYHWLNSASRVLISTCSTPLVQTGEHKHFSLFDLDLKSQATNPQAKNQDQRSNGSNRRAPTDKRGEHMDAIKRIITPATRSIINWLPWQHPLGYHKTYASFVIPIHVTIYAEQLTKIGLIVADKLTTIVKLKLSCSAISIC